MELKNITLEEVEVPVHHHPLIPFTRFELGQCVGCNRTIDEYIYGGYRCNELECDKVVFHKECAMPLLTINHSSHPNHPLHLLCFLEESRCSHKDEMSLPESILCIACVFQICSEPFYSCEQCDFILHQKCANFLRKIHHVANNKPFTLQTDSPHESFECYMCYQTVTGFRYISYQCSIIDVRCGSLSERLQHGSHIHPLYYTTSSRCNRCSGFADFGCDECDFGLDSECATLPEKVMRLRYDDHPLFLSYGENNVNGDYWCEACETKVDSTKWFYTCSDCGVVLHISCVIGDFSYINLGTRPGTPSAEVVPNNSVDRRLCFMCNSRCILSSILQIFDSGTVVYFCSNKCFYSFSPTKKRNTPNKCIELFK